MNRRRCRVARTSQGTLSLNPISYGGETRVATGLVLSIRLKHLRFAIYKY
jgi:hypothetical protein